MTPPRATVAFVASLGLIAACMAAVLLVVIAQHGRILHGTTVAGVDVGGQDVASARRVLAPVAEAEQRRRVAVSTPGARHFLDPRDVGLSFDVSGSASDAYARGRRWRVSSVAARLLAPTRTVEVMPRRTVDLTRLAAWVDDLADDIEREASAGSFHIEHEGTAPRVRAAGPHGALRVDRDASVEALAAALTSGERSVRLIATAELPPIGHAPIERITDDVALALMRPTVVRHDGRTLSIAPDVMARLIASVTTTDGSGRPQPMIAVPTHRVIALLGQEARDTFDRAGQDAQLVTARTPQVTLADLQGTAFRPLADDIAIRPSASTTTFRPRLLAAQLTNMLLERQRVADLDIEEIPAAITTAELEVGRPTHLLGTFTTFLAPATPRAANIALLADILDDHAIAPGATFSINETSGPRTCEDGFVPAGTIIRGELVDTCGGGVSQVGTTVLNAAFFAGLELNEWQPHSFFISRYPAGREATLTFPEIDVRFTNDTDGWLVLRSSTTPDSVTVSIYGIPRWREVRSVHGERRTPTDFDREERRTTEIAPGARRVIQAGAGGFTTTVERVRLPIDPTTDTTGQEVRERWTIRYQPQRRIVEIGALSAPPPDPSAADPGGLPPQ